MATATVADTDMGMAHAMVSLMASDLSALHILAASQVSEHLVASVASASPMAGSDDMTSAVHPLLLSQKPLRLRKILVTLPHLRLRLRPASLVVVTTDATSSLMTSTVSFVASDTA